MDTDDVGAGACGNNGSDVDDDVSRENSQVCVRVRACVCVCVLYAVFSTLWMIRLHGSSLVGCVINKYPEYHWAGSFMDIAQLVG